MQFLGTHCETNLYPNALPVTTQIKTDDETRKTYEQRTGNMLGLGNNKPIIWLHIPPVLYLQAESCT